MASGKHKAAALLMNLEPAAAAELLKAAKPETITAIATELAFLDSSGFDPSGDDSPVREFSGLLKKGAGDRLAAGGAFIKDMLESALGRPRSEEVLSRVESALQIRDPFKEIKTSETKKIAAAVRGESAQVIAMVLAELSPAKSVSLLSMLDEDIRALAIQGMVIGETVSLQAKLHVATAIERRLRSLESEAAAAGPSAAAVVTETEEEIRDAKLRKVSILLRGLKTEDRDGLMGGIRAQDDQAAKDVERLMIVWEDIPIVADRSMQEALRAMDSRRLALALVDAEENLIAQIRSNMSERASTMLDEETSLLSEPKPEEIAEAREALLDTLREMNSKGELEFELGEN